MNFEQRKQLRKRKIIAREQLTQEERAISREKVMLSAVYIQK